MNSSKKIHLRNRLSYKYIKSCKGIEIGPGFTPLKVLPEVKTIYVDLMSVEDLLKTYPGLKGKNLVKTDVIDDGEELKKFKSDTLDFVIANHLNRTYHKSYSNP